MLYIIMAYLRLADPVSSFFSYKHLKSNLKKRGMEIQIEVVG